MAILQCYECHHQVSDQAKSCPSCGAEFQVKHKTSVWRILAVLLVLMIVGPVLTFGGSILFGQVGLLVGIVLGLFMLVVVAKLPD